MTYIQEPYVNIDLTVQYQSIDLRPNPNTPAVGIVLRSDYYARYFFSLSERQRNIERRAIEINTKREYLEKITRNNYILPSDHLSLKNGYYLAGTVRLFVAPEIPIPGWNNQTYNLTNNNITSAITLVDYVIYHIDSSHTPNYDMLMSMVINDNGNWSIYTTSPRFRGSLSNTLSIGGTAPNIFLQMGTTNIQFIEVEGIMEQVLYVYQLALYPMPSYMTVAGPHYVIRTDNHAILFISTGSAYEVYVFKKLANIIPDIKAFCLNTQYVRLYACDSSFLPIMPGHTIPITSSASDLAHFMSFWNDLPNSPNNYYFYANYLTAHRTGSTPYDYLNNLYGNEYIISGTTYHVEDIQTLYSSSPLSWGVTLTDYDHSTNTTTTYSHTVGACSTIPSSGVLRHNISFQPGPVCTLVVPTAPSGSVINTSSSAYIAKLTQVVKYDTQYTYTLTTFNNALELLNMVDMITDNGYSHNQADYPQYAPVISAWAARIDTDKFPALAVITLPINTRPSSALNVIPPTSASSTFLCTNYFKNEGLGYATMLPASSLYVQKVVAMYEVLQGFSPIFNKSIVPVMPIDRIYNKRERELLLDKRINSLFMHEGSWAFNNNLTATSDNIIFKEENIRRLANTVARECMQLLKKFIGLQNNPRTRSQVVSTILRMKETIIDPHEYKPDEFIVKCDESNNRDLDRYLYVTIIVKMPLSIKYIELVTVALDLQQA